MRRCGKYASRADHAGAVGYRSGCMHTQEAHTKVDARTEYLFWTRLLCRLRRTMVLHRASTMKKSDYNFKCYTYGKRGKGECTPHHIREEELYAIILDDLRRVTHFARQKERQFAEYINRKNTAQLRQEINALQMQLDTMCKRRSELTTLF